MSGLNGRCELCELRPKYRMICNDCIALYCAPHFAMQLERMAMHAIEEG